MSARSGLHRLRQELLSQEQPRFGESCPQMGRWLLVYGSTGDQWSDDELNHIESCTMCSRQRAGYEQPSELEKAQLNSYRKLSARFGWIFHILLVVLGPAVMYGILSGVISEYDFTSSLSNWAAEVRSRIWTVAVAIFGALGSLWTVGRREGWSAANWASLGLGMLSLTIGTIYTQQTATQYASEEIIQREELFQSTRWVHFDSSFVWHGDPDAVEKTGHAGHVPTTQQLRFELAALKDAGFAGICLYSNPNIEFLELAKSEFGFAIIQGIPVPDSDQIKVQDLSDPETQRQIRQAIAASDFIDAIVLRGLHSEKVKMTQLQDELAKIRQRTGKPVTPCFLLSEYLNKHGITESGRNLLALSDFVVTDLDRPYSHDPPSGDPAKAAAKVADAIDELKDFGLPTMLSFVGYPSAGGEGFSEENQRKFIEQVMEFDRPRGLGISYSGAFDLPWKQSQGKGEPWECEGHLGFFRTELSDDELTATFTPKPAFEVLSKGRP